MVDGEVTFRHKMPVDGERVSIPADVALDRISMEVDADGRAHLLWIETDGQSIPNH